MHGQVYVEVLKDELRGSKLAVVKPPHSGQLTSWGADIHHALGSIAYCYRSSLAVLQNNRGGRPNTSCHTPTVRLGDWAALCHTQGEATPHTPVNLHILVCQQQHY